MRQWIVIFSLLLTNFSFAKDFKAPAVPSSIRSLKILDPNDGVTGPIFRVYTRYYYEGGTHIEYDQVSKYSQVMVRRKLDYLKLKGPKQAFDKMAKRSGESAMFCCQHSDIKLEQGKITFKVGIDNENFKCTVFKPEDEDSKFSCKKI